VSFPFPIWDRNQGNILAASSALVRAAEGPHAVEVALTSGLATAYAGYKSNLAAVEYYRRNILPDQVRYYRGVFERRRIDPSVAFGDLVQAQQVLVADVTSYLGVLGTLWTSVVSVANFLQTDDLYQLGDPLELPHLPDFDALHPLPCPHNLAVCPPAGAPAITTPVPHSGVPAPPAPTMPMTLGQWLDKPKAVWSVDLFTQATDPDQSAGNPERTAPVLGRPSRAPSTLMALREYAAKFLGVLEVPFDDPSSAAIPPVAQPSEALAPDSTRRPSAASLSRSSS
jgi:cobalt-zinc-cadmium efflux system outer membrane protein